MEHNSAKLEVNDLKNKVRRIDPLPEYDETTPSRTVMALDVPLDRPTIESVAELFSTCGEITLVRILRPGNPVPADVRPFVSKHPEMATKVCALIEFECTEFAMAAVESLNNNEEGKMKVKIIFCKVKEDSNWKENFKCIRIKISRGLIKHGKSSRQDEPSKLLSSINGSDQDLNFLYFLDNLKIFIEFFR